MMIRIFFAGVLLMACVACSRSSGSSEPGEQKQKRVRKAERKKQKAEADLSMEEKLALLVKDETLKDYFSIDEKGISLYASPEAKAADSAECRVYPSEYGAFAKLFYEKEGPELLQLYLAKGMDPWPDSVVQSIGAGRPDFRVNEKALLPLDGLKVAIDPGHVAADMELAELEGKYVKMRASRETGFKEIAFNEATLTLATAYILRDMLEAEGATVLITRTEPGVSAFGQTYDQWKSNSVESTIRELEKLGSIDSARADYYRRKATEKDKFRRLFTAKDLRERARKINAFRPDVTVIIHYNIHSPNWEKRDEEGFFPTTDANYSMAFAPGSFMKGELDEPEERLEFLRLLLTDDMEASIRFSALSVQQFKKKAKVKPVEPDEELPYLDRACIRAKPLGVYTRNLTLTRLVHGPLTYGETLCQDNKREVRILNRKDLKVRNLQVSSRVKTVAKAYYEAIYRFYSQG